MRRFCILLLLWIVFLPVKAWELSALGSGQTLEEAQKNALSHLAQQIQSRIESHFESKLKVTDNQVQRQGINTLKQEAQIFLKGVQYTTLKKQPYEVKAWLGIAALNETLAFLKAESHFEPAHLPLNQIPAIKQKLSWIRSLALMHPQKTIQEKYLHWVKTQEKWLEARWNDAILFIEVIPQDAKLFIDQHKQPLNQPIVISPGRTKVLITRPGYQNYEKIIQLYPKSLWVKKITLTPEIDQKTQLEIGDDLLSLTDMDRLSQIWQDLGWQIDPHTSNRFVVKTQHQVFQAGNFERQVWTFRISFYRGKHRIKTLTYKQKITLNTQQTMQGFVDIWSLLEGKFKTALQRLTQAIAANPGA